MRAMIKMSQVLERTKDNPEYYKELMDCGTVINDILYIQPKDFVKLKTVVRKHTTNKAKVIVKQTQQSGSFKSRIRLGDKVALIAKPIAKGIDKVLGTNIQNCGGCAKRQERLNNLI